MSSPQGIPCGVLAETQRTSPVSCQMPGPVLLVGHSYGGAVITDAASQSDNVIGLVYVAT